MKRKDRLAYLMAALLACGLLTTEIYVERVNDQRHAERVRHAMDDRGNQVRRRLQSTLYHNLQLAQGIRGIVALKPNLSQSDFERAAQPLLNESSQLRNIGLAPGMVIRMMSPLAGNEKALGLAYSKLPSQFESADRARRTRQLVLAGPVALVQGGTGFISRVPVFLKGKDKREEFWGLISAVIDTDRLYRASGLMDAGLPMEIAIRGKDAKGPEGEVFFGRAAVFDEHPVLSEIALPVGSWQLAAVPRGGWPVRADDAWLLRLAFMVVALLVLGPIIAMGRAMRRADEARAEAESERARVALSEKKFRGLFELSPLGITLNDYASGRFLDINDALLAPTGYNRDELMALNYWDLTPKDYAEQEQEQLLAMERSGSYGPYEKEHIRKDGGRYPVLLSGIKLIDPTGRPVIWSIVQDISARKRDETALREATATAEAASRAKSLFLASMSHELRTPLNAILGFAQLIGMELDLPEETRAYADEVKQAGQHLLALVNDLIDLARIEAGKLEFNLDRVPVHSVLANSLAMVAPIARNQGIELRQSVGTGESASIRVDYVRLRQAVINLLANAIKYNRPQGSVCLSCRRIGDRVRIAVADTGPGIPADKQSRIFKAFDRLGAERGSVEGTGIGLIITQRMVLAMGGDIGFESVEGQGSTFWLEFPAIEAGEAGEDSEPAEADLIGLAEIPDPKGGRPVVLYIEDNPINLRLMQGIFAVRADMELRDAHTAELGIELAWADPPALILMDINLPGMDGYEALARLRADPRTAQVPVLAVSANAMKGDQARGMQAGFAAYIAKPVDIPALFAAVDNCLAQPGTRA